MRSEAEKNIGGHTAILEDDDKKIKMVEKEREEEKILEREADKWKRLNDIFGSADGKRFKQITQSYILMQLLENANYYLRQFTTRYELTAQPGSLVILITDREDNDVSRPSNTLSGGESFMVSLALALGLSSLNRNSFTPDTLFIDEGFGTLSSDSLNTVIETLEVLHSMGNRRVGIISHVNELHERIATRIEVKKRAGVSEIKIVR
jgi:exonuclease SbcC